MFDYLRYRLTLAKLQKERRGVIQSLPQPVPGQEFVLFDGDQNQLDLVEHKIYRLMSDYYWEQAFKFGIPFPQGKEYWETSSAFPGTDHLNRKGLTAVRSAIHEERKKRSEFFAVWVVGLTGLVGAITGLVSVLAHKG